jgi:hypothetical protein
VSPRRITGDDENEDEVDSAEDANDDGEAADDDDEEEEDDDGDDDKREAEGAEPTGGDNGAGGVGAGGIDDDEDEEEPSAGSGSSTSAEFGSISSSEAEESCCSVTPSAGRRFRTSGGTCWPDVVYHPAINVATTSSIRCILSVMVNLRASPIPFHGLHYIQVKPWRPGKNKKKAKIIFRYPKSLSLLRKVFFFFTFVFVFAVGCVLCHEIFSSARSALEKTI